jgi:molecular chaperone GrpE
VSEGGNQEEQHPPEPEGPGGDGDDELTVDDILGAASDDGQAADDAVTVLQATLEERTRDLQRITAEFQNYRKRVERDKARSGELATAAVLQSLLPVLDDLDRARSHGDLNGPFGAVADQLGNALAKHGLESFGEKGDGFDPQIHEAVAHMQMPDVEGPTCIDVMRSGYRLGEKLLRPALVAVAEPLDEPAAAAEPDPEPEAPAAEPADEEPAEKSEDAPEAEAEFTEPVPEVEVEDEESSEDPEPPADGKGKGKKKK